LPRSVIIPPQPDTVQVLDGAFRRKSFCMLGDIVSILLGHRPHTR
jgi:hypothetical protein